MKQRIKNKLAELEKPITVKNESCVYFYQPGEELPQPKEGCKAIVYLPDNGR